MRKLLANIFILFFLFFLSWLLRPVLQNQLTGTFIYHTIPSTYQKFAQILAKDKTFYRTFWVPTVPTYSFYSFNHPQVSGEDFLQVTTTQAVLEFLQKPSAQNTLQEMGVKYIVVPIDSEKKIFLTERKYDNKKYLATVSSLKKINWLHHTSLFGNLVVFQIDNPKDHFWLQNTQGKLMYNRISPTQYHVSLRNVQKGEQLIFAETFDPRWILQRNNQQIQALNYHHMNSFLLPKKGNYDVTITYQPQKWVLYGAIISIISFVFLIALTIYFIILFYQRKIY